MSTVTPTEATPLPSFFQRTVFGDAIQPYADTFIFNGLLRISQDHPVTYAITQARSLTPFLAGQALIGSLAKHLHFTPEQVSLVLNGLDPVDHPDAASLPHEEQLKIVRLTADLVEIIGQHLNNFRTDVFSRMDDELLQAVGEGDESLNLVPAEIEGRPLAGSFALLRPTGGVFQSISGIGLVYGNPFDLTDQVIYLLDIQAVENDAEAKEAMGRVLGQLLTFRNNWFDKIVGDYFNTELEGLVKKYRLTDEEVASEDISEEDTVTDTAPVDDDYIGQAPDEAKDET